MSAIARILSGEVPATRRVALRDGAALSLASFRADIAGTAGHLRALGCRRGSVVCRDGYWLLVGLLGLLAAGAEVVFPPNTQAGTLARLAGSWDRVLTDDPALGQGEVFLPALERHAIPAALTLRGDRVVFFTSGSTGEPKPVIRTLGELEREATHLERLWGELADRATVFATVPHHHVYGLTFARLWPLVAGRPFAAAVHDFWESLLQDMSAGAVVITSPAHLTRLGGMAPLDHSRRPRLIFSAGAPLPYGAIPDVMRVLGSVPHEIFGSTETGAIATRQPKDADTPWRALPGIEVGADAAGRLRLHSPWVVGGGWFETSDRIEPAPDTGGFHLLGRVDRTVKIEGKRVSLVEVERCLTALAWVTEASVTVLPEGSGVLAAAVVLTGAGRDELARRGVFRFTRALRRELAAFLEPVALPRRWRFPDALPTAALGKRNAAEIAALFGPAVPQ